MDTDQEHSLKTRHTLAGALLVLGGIATLATCLWSILVTDGGWAWAVWRLLTGFMATVGVGCLVAGGLDVTGFSVGLTGSMMALWAANLWLPVPHALGIAVALTLIPSFFREMRIHLAASRTAAAEVAEALSGDEDGAISAPTPRPPPEAPRPKLPGGTPAAETTGVPVAALPSDATPPELVNYAQHPVAAVDQDPSPSADGALCPPLQPPQLAAVQALPARVRNTPPPDAQRQMAQRLYDAIHRWARPLRGGRLVVERATPLHLRLRFHPVVDGAEDFESYLDRVQRSRTNLAGVLGFKGPAASRLHVEQVPGEFEIDFVLSAGQGQSPGFRELVLSPEYATARSAGRFVLILGETEDGELVTLDKGHPSSPHDLVAGQTGSGKSCVANAQISSALAAYPEDVAIYIVDPKGTTFSIYAGLPGVTHLPHPTTEQVDMFMHELELLRQQRQKTVGEWGFEDLSDAERAGHRLGRILVVVDELAILADEAKGYKRPKDSDVPAYDVSLAKLYADGRTAGMHVLGLTQRPDADVISGRTKANATVRIGLRMRDKTALGMLFGDAAAQITWSFGGPGDAACLIGEAVHRVRIPHYDREAAKVFCAALKKQLQVSDASGAHSRQAAE